MCRPPTPPATSTGSAGRWVSRSSTTYGISYGTILGATYANLFPAQVRAMTLDSNIAPSAWTNDASGDARLTTFLRVGSDRSAAATLDRFLDLCGSTTTSRCAFSAGSAQATRDKFDRLTTRLRKDPSARGPMPATVADTVNSLYLVQPGGPATRRAGSRHCGRAVRLSPPPSRPHRRSRTRVRIWVRSRQRPCSAATAPTRAIRGVYHALEEASAARAGDAGRFWTWAAAGRAPPGRPRRGRYDRPLEQADREPRPGGRHHLRPLDGLSATRGP